MLDDCSVREHSLWNLKEKRKIVYRLLKGMSQSVSLLFISVGFFFFFEGGKVFVLFFAFLLLLFYGKHLF